MRWRAAFCATLLLVLLRAVWYRPPALTVTPAVLATNAWSPPPPPGQFPPAAFASPHFSPPPAVQPLVAKGAAKLTRAAMRHRKARADATPPTTAPLLFMLKTASKDECTLLRGVHINGRSCKRECTPEQQTLSSMASKPSARVGDGVSRPFASPRWLEALPSDANAGAAGFAGNETLSERARSLRQCGGDESAGAKCGFLAPSVRASSAKRVIYCSFASEYPHCAPRCRA